MWSILLLTNSWAWWKSLLLRRCWISTFSWDSSFSRYLSKFFFYFQLIIWMDRNKVRLSILVILSMVKRCKEQSENFDTSRRGAVFLTWNVIIFLEANILCIFKRTSVCRFTHWCSRSSPFPVQFDWLTDSSFSMFRSTVFPRSIRINLKTAKVQLVQVVTSATPIPTILGMIPATSVWMSCPRPMMDMKRRKRNQWMRMQMIFIPPAYRAWRQPPQQ